MSYLTAFSIMVRLFLVSFRGQMPQSMPSHLLYSLVSAVGNTSKQFCLPNYLPFCLMAPTLCVSYCVVLEDQTPTYYMKN